MPSINITFVILNWKLTVTQKWSVGFKWTQMNTDVLSGQIKKAWDCARCSVQNGCYFLKCYSTRNSGENFQIAHCSEPSAISQMIQFTARLLKKPCVFIFFAAKFSKWPETKRFCEWIKHMDLLKDLRADLTLAPMQCCHSSTVHQRYIFLKSHSSYCDAILFFVYIYRI